MDREYKLAYSQIPIHNNYEILDMMNAISILNFILRYLCISNRIPLLRYVLSLQHAIIRDHEKDTDLDGIVEFRKKVSLS